MALDIHRLRAGEGLERDLAVRVWERIKAGEAATDIATDELAQVAIERFTPRIRHAMGRAGFPLPEGELTPQNLAQVIGDAMGLDLADLTPESIADALDRRMAAEVSRRLGIEVESLRDPQALQEAAKAAIIDAVKTGRANKLISKLKIRQMRNAAAWAQAGIGPGEREQYLNRWYQKKYRRTHREVWD